MKKLVSSSVGVMLGLSLLGVAAAPAATASKAPRVTVSATKMAGMPITITVTPRVNSAVRCSGTLTLAGQSFALAGLQVPRREKGQWTFTPAQQQAGWAEANVRCGKKRQKTTFLIDASFSGIAPDVLYQTYPPKRSQDASFTENYKRTIPSSFWDPIGDYGMMRLAKEQCYRLDNGVALSQLYDELLSRWLLPEYTGALFYAAVPVYCPQYNAVLAEALPTLPPR